MDQNYNVAVSGRCLTIYALYANEVFDNITSDWTKCNAVNTVNKTPDVKCDWIILEGILYTFQRHDDVNDFKMPS